MSNNYEQINCMYKYKSVRTERWYCTEVYGRPENGICDKCVKRKTHQLSKSDQSFLKLGYKIYMECDGYISYIKSFLNNWFKEIDIEQLSEFKEEISETLTVADFSGFTKSNGSGNFNLLKRYSIQKYFSIFFIL